MVEISSLFIILFIYYPCNRIHEWLVSEFRSQLPHEGGAFYSSDTMDTVRKFYKDTWPSVLNAATLWLCNGGFEETGRNSIPNLPRNLHTYVVQSNKSIEEINADYFHLVFGK